MRSFPQSVYKKIGKIWLKKVFPTLCPQNFPNLREKSLSFEGRLRSYKKTYKKTLDSCTWFLFIWVLKGLCLWLRLDLNSLYLFVRFPLFTNGKAWNARKTLFKEDFVILLSISFHSKYSCKYLSSKLFSLWFSSRE